MLKQILKRVKLRTIIILIMLLMFNSYAWFVFQTKVSGRISAHIEAWDVMFKAGNDETVSNVEFNVDRIYPGMTDYVQEIQAYNDGEKPAKVSYIIREVTILGETYTNEVGTDLSALIASNTYPFHISIVIDNEIMDAGNGSSKIVISVKWPFEQGTNTIDIEQKDLLDTQWGEQAADFYRANPNVPSINIKVELKATQVE